MNKKEKIALKKEAKKLFYDFMDKKDKMYQVLLNFETKHRIIPEEYKSDIMLMNAYKEYKRFGGWRKVPGCKLILNKAIKKYTKKKVENPQPEKEMTIKEKEKYLKRKTEEIYKNVAKAKKEVEDIHNKY